MTSLQRPMMIAKIHRATVTQADLHYVGSVTVDVDLLDAADLLPGQQVDVVDVTNGARLTTYVIPGERGSGADLHQRRGRAPRAPGRRRHPHRLRHARGRRGAHLPARTSSSSTSRTASSTCPTTPARCRSTAATCTAGSEPSGVALAGVRG